MNAILRLACCMWLVTASFTTTAATVEDARQLLAAAVAEVAAVGGEKAAQNFITNEQWRVGAMYVTLSNFQAKILAHSANPKMVGKIMLEAKDAAGKPFVALCLQDIKARGECLIDMKWGNPLTKKFDDAQMTAKRVPGKELYVSVILFK